jgi:peroxiredoxin
MITRRLTPFAPVALFAAALLSMPAEASLPVGAKAPPFVAQGALAGKPFAFNLQAALKKGPVVLYFYPKAFTSGCTQEAHAFAEASADFAKEGATVIGMSADDLPTLQRFSTEACRDKFAVASASSVVIKGYDVALSWPLGSITNRTSYVIGQNGTIVMTHSNMDWRDHVRLTLEAVRKLRRGS